jgi:hypothetical protein
MTLPFRNVWSIWTFLPLLESPRRTGQKRYVHLLIAAFLDVLQGNQC